MKFCHKQKETAKEAESLLEVAFSDVALSQSEEFERYHLLTGDNDQGCLGDNYCPPKCICTGTVVRCSRVRLQEIPRGIPPETSEL